MLLKCFVFVMMGVEILGADAPAALGNDFHEHPFDLAQPNAITTAYQAAPDSEIPAKTRPRAPNRQSGAYRRMPCKYAAAKRRVFAGPRLVAPACVHPAALSSVGVKLTAPATWP